MKNYKPLNPHREGIARTIKATYQKQSLANFIRKGSMGATGVIEYEQIQKDLLGYSISMVEKEELVFPEMYIVPKA